jgi:hypothetical protein
MKNQYFGDINDFRKYGILRGLAGPPLRLVVSWMLTPDDGRSDGKFTSYLAEPTRWGQKDPELFHFLRKEVHEKGKRGVASLESSGILPSAKFISTVLDGSPETRNKWLNETLDLAGLRSLVFFDPDNGLEAKSVRKGSLESSKYLIWDEVERVWSKGSSLLIYQHFIRENRERFLNRLAGEFCSRLGAVKISVLRTANVAFFLVPQKDQAEVLHRRAEQIGVRWGDEIRIEHFAR